MFDILGIRIAKYRSYWALQKFLSMQKFRLDRASFLFSGKTKRTKLGLRVLIQLLRLSSKGIFVASLLVLVLKAVELYVNPLLLRYVSIPVKLAKDAHEYVELIGQISASFLGIYFATFGIILSSSYNKFREDVLELILNEKVNNIYSIYLIYLTVFCLLSSSLGYVNVNLGYSLFFSAVIGGSIAVICLFELGKRLFFFFDTTRLVEVELVPEIASTIVAMSAGQFGSVHLQAHQQKITEKRIDTLRYLAARSSTDEIGATDSVQRIDAAYARLLTLYASCKQNISRESYWFKRRSVHPNWFLESDTSTGMALETDTFIQPKEEPDHFWLENLLISGLEESLRKSILRRDFRTALFTLQHVSFVVEKRAKSLLVDESIDLVPRFEAILDAILDDAPALPIVELSARLDLDEIAMHDQLAWATSTFAIEYLRHTIIQIRSFAKNFQSVSWKGNTFGKLPASLHAQLRQHQQRIDFEIKVEGQQITPDRFILQLLSKEFVESIGKALFKIKGRYQASLVDRIEILTDRQRADIAVHLLFGAIRSVHQIRYFLENLAIDLDALYKNEIYGDYPIEQINIADQISTYDSMYIALLEKISNKEIIEFITRDLRHNETLPDYFGHCYFKLADECYGCLSDNKPELFAKIFPAFFVLSQISGQRFEIEKHRYSTEYHMALIASANSDLASISGYASLYGEVWNDKRCRSIVERVWRDFLASQPDQNAYLLRLLVFSSYQDSTFSIGPRDIIRTGWEQSFQSKLREDGFGDIFDYHQRKKHPSALVRASESLSFHKPSYVFLAEFVVPTITDETKYSNGLKSFIRSLEREQKAG